MPPTQNRTINYSFNAFFYCINPEFSVGFLNLAQITRFESKTVDG